MSRFELNKIAASILLASLIIMFVGTIVDALYQPKLVSAQRGYSVEALHSADSTTSDPKEVKIDIAALMKNANSAAGENIIKKCLACHSIDKGGVNKVGPNLWNIVGKTKASADGYKYSTAMISKGGKWEYEDLFHFLHKPSQYLPGTKMSFVGLSKPEDVANVIEFLRSKASDNPLALQ